MAVSTSLTRECLQAAGRRVAYHTFSHVLDLDVGFHLEKRTGALSRILERGQATVAYSMRQRDRHPTRLNFSLSLYLGLCLGLYDMPIMAA